MPSKGLEIPYEVADGITLTVLKDQLEYLEEELRLYHDEGKWMHPEDVKHSKHELIPAFKVLVKYFGG